MNNKKTPNEIAENRIKQREQLNKLIGQYGSRSNLRKAIEKQKQIKANRKKADTLTRVGSTLADLVGNVAEGAVKSVEGVFDAGVGLIGGIGGLFSDDFKKGAQDIVDYDFTGNTVGKIVDDLSQNSYLKDSEIGRTVENVANGVGQMLPAVGLSVATGGASLLPLGAMTVSSVGTGMEQAFNDGADYYQGLGYGLTEGAIQGVTEKMFDGLGGLTGKGVLDGITQGVATTGFKRVAKTTAEEGLENIASSLVEPLAQTIYKGKDALNQYGNKDYWGSVAESGAVGGLTSLAYGGTVGRVMKSTGVYGDVRNSLEQINKLNKTSEELFNNDNLDTKNETKIKEATIKNYKNIENALNKASDRQKKYIIERYNLGDKFNPNGTIKEEFKNSLINSSINKYISAGLRGKEKELNKSLSEQNTKLFNGEMDEVQKANYKKFKKVLSALSEKKLISPEFAVTEENDKFNAFTKNGVLAIGVDSFKNDSWQNNLIHELTHFSEGSKEYLELAKFILKNTDIKNALKDIVGKKYTFPSENGEKIAITEEDISSFLSRINKEKYNMTSKDRMILSELISHQSENILTNEDFINKLAKSKRNIVTKILDKIKQFISVIKEKSPQEKELLKKLYKTQSLFEKALDLKHLHFASDSEKANTSFKSGEALQYSLKNDENNEKDNIINREKTNEVKTSDREKMLMKKIRELTSVIENEREEHTLANKLLTNIDKVKGLEKYKNSDIEYAKEVSSLIKLIGKMQTFRGSLSTNIREIMKDYSKQFDGTPLYEKLQNNSEENPFKEQIEEIAKGNGKLSVNELNNLNNILENFIHNVKNYDRVFFDNKERKASELSKKAISEVNVASKLVKFKNGSIFTKIKNVLETPEQRFERLGGYDEDSVVVKLYKELENSFNDRACRLEMQTDNHFKKFKKENKKYLENLYKQDYEIANGEIRKLDPKDKSKNKVKISKGQLISLYLTAQREQGLKHLLFNGNSGMIDITNDKVSLKNTPKEGFNRGNFDVEITKDTLSQLKDKVLNDTDKKFIDLVNSYFNDISKKAKRQTDLEMFGVSNVEESSDYYPIKVSKDAIFQKIGENNFRLSDMFKSFSFNKDLKPNASNKVVIENVVDVLNRHSNQLKLYYGYSRTIDSINKILNQKTEDGTLRSTILKVDSSFNDYLNRLIKDVLGNKREHTTLDTVLGKVRKGYVEYALGANLKVFLTQFVSAPASAIVGLKADNIAKGVAQAMARKTDLEKMFEYTPMLYVRFKEGNMTDIGLLKENQGLLGNLDVITNLTTKPITKIDSLVCCGIWNAALEQTKNSGIYENFSDEHYKTASELTRKAIERTQTNYAQLLRPEILRSQNELIRLGCVFMGEPLRQFSLIVGSIEKYKVSKERLRLANISGNEAEIKKAQALFKEAKAQGKRALTVIFIDTLIMTGITQLFKWIKGQKDKNKGLGVLSDFADNYVGMFPFARDIYNYLVHNYDISNIPYTGLINLADGLKGAVSIFTKTTTTPRLQIRKMLFGIGQLLGIPLKNLEAYSIGILDKFSGTNAKNDMGNLRYDYYNWLYSGQYDKSVVGKEALKEAKTKLFYSAIEQKKLDKILKEAKKITADHDKNGNVIKGSKKLKLQKYIRTLGLTAVQKYMLMGLLGYKNKNGYSLVKRYINSLKLTKESKELLFKYSGYTINTKRNPFGV